MSGKVSNIGSSDILGEKKRKEADESNKKDNDAAKDRTGKDEKDRFE